MNAVPLTEVIDDYYETYERCNMPKTATQIAVLTDFFSIL